MCTLPAIANARHETFPFSHWHLQNVLSPADLAEIAAISLAAPQEVETAGRRETHNASRRFFDTEVQRTYPACGALANLLQSPLMAAAWETLTGTDLKGTNLRIEYCQDMGGFWLEPHTDIGAKRFTMLLYLTDPPHSECWGTDLLTPDGKLAVRATGAANSAIIFIPSANSWHGFAPRPITGVRKTLIINYVVPEWRARHELCFPGQPISA